MSVEILLSLTQIRISKMCFGGLYCKLYVRMQTLENTLVDHGSGFRFGTPVWDPSKPNAWKLAHSTQQQMGTRLKHRGNNGGEERNWPPYLIMPMAQTNVLFNRHFPDVRVVYETHLYPF